MDIDIDFADRKKILDIIKHVPATIIDKDGTSKKHNTGIYCHSIPYNPLTGTASIEYKEAEDRKYFKIDFLNVGIYEGVKDEEHLIRTGRFCQFTISRQRSWTDFKADETNFCTTTSGGVSNDSACKTLFDRERLEYDKRRGLDKATRR